MSDIAIRVEGLGKQYRIGGPSAGLRTGPQARYKTIRESLTEAVPAGTTSARALMRVAVTASDRPGGTGQAEAEKTV